MGRIGLLSLLLLPGCQAIDVKPVAEPEQNLTPPAEVVQHAQAPRGLDLDIDDVALEAEETVARYLSVTDSIGAEGGISAEPMRALATADWYPREQDGFRHYQDRRIRTLGHTRFDQFAIQSARVSVSGQLEVAVFLCVDSTGVWVVDTESPEPPDGLLQWLLDGADQEVVTDEQLELWQPYLDEVQPVAGTREPIVVWLVGESATELLVDGTENWLGHHPCELTP